MIAALDATGELPAELSPSMEDVMQNRITWKDSELYPVYRALIAAGVVLDAVEIAVVAWWIATGDWRPFALGMPLVIAACALMVRAYRRRTAYVCPHCREVFVPRAAEWFFAAHTPTTRKVTCSSCGTKDWCAEVSSKRLPR